MTVYHVTDYVAITLTVTLSEEYPDVPPGMVVECTRGKYSQLEKLKADLLEEANKNLGMAMVFTLITFIEETINTFNENNSVQKAEQKAKQQEEIAEEKVQLAPTWLVNLNSRRRNSMEPS